jgi:hypothetical protein
MRTFVHSPEGANLTEGDARRELHTTTQQAHTHVTPEQKTIGVSIAVVLLGAAIYFFFKSKNLEPEVVVER